MRTKPGVTAQAAAAELGEIARRTTRTDSAATGVWQVGSWSLHEFLNHVPQATPSVLALQVAAVFVLLIACANLANLRLARSNARWREIAIRMAVGAGRGHLLRQLLVEAGVLSVCGGTAGVVMAYAGTRALVGCCSNSARFDWQHPERAHRPIPLGQNASMTILHADGRKLSDVNENSLVVRLDLGNSRVMLMGDAEAGSRKDPSVPPTATSTEGQLLACCAADLSARVMVVGHHGSMTSSRRACAAPVPSGSLGDLKAQDIDGADLMFTRLENPTKRQPLQSNLFGISAG